MSERESTLLALDAIRVDPAIQSRAFSEAHCGRLVEHLQSEGAAPPVIVYRDGNTLWLADGFHRLEAYKRAGKHQIPAEVRAGNARAARLCSLGANHEHGLPASDDECFAAAEEMLRDPEWSKWSDRRIAKHCGVSPQTVGRRRAGLSVPLEQIGSAPTTRLVERNGTTYALDTSNLSRKPTATPAPTPAPRAEPEPRRPFAQLPLTPEPAPAETLEDYSPDGDDRPPEVFDASKIERAREPKQPDPASMSLGEWESDADTVARLRAFVDWLNDARARRPLHSIRDEAMRDAVAGWLVNVANAALAWVPDGASRTPTPRPTLTAIKGGR